MEPQYNIKAAFAHGKEDQGDIKYGGSKKKNFKSKTRLKTGSKYANDSTGSFRVSSVSQRKAPTQSMSGLRAL